MTAVRYRVRHETVYSYGGNVAHSHQLLHLTPRNTPLQSCRDRTISLAPQPSSRSEDLDAFGNHVTRLEYDSPHDHLEVLAEVGVEVQPAPDMAPPRAMPGSAFAIRCVFRQAGERGNPGRLPLPHGVELRQDQADLHRVWRGLLRAGCADAGSRRRR
jgi:transglutaminase-like putative cysteine protease